MNELSGADFSLLAALAAVFVLTGVWFIAPARRFLLALLGSGLLGLGALWLLSRFGEPLGVRVGLNALTMLTAFLLGPPGAGLLALAGYMVT